VASVQHTIRIAAQPAHVFDLLTDTARFPIWKDGVLAVHDAPTALEHAGAGYTAAMRAFPIGPTVHCRFEIIRVERPSLIVQHGRTPAGPTISTDRLRPVDGGTELAVTVEYKLRGGPLGQIASALFMRRMLAHVIGQSLAKLKALAEA
jgi:uncharacterized protein YndB with AHSA1/START domain